MSKPVSHPVEPIETPQNPLGKLKPMSISPGKLKHMKALSNDKGIIAAAAMDQRGSLRKSIAAAKGVSADKVTQEQMEEFKVVVSKVLTPHASAILLDPEFGLPAAKARAKNAGLLLAYEETGYDHSKPGRLPDLLPLVSVKRIKEDMGADAVKILLYYAPNDTVAINDHKSAFIERVGAECDAYDIPFFCEFIVYDANGMDEKSLEFAKEKPGWVTAAMKEFSQDKYKIDVLKVEVPINPIYVEGSVVFKGQIESREDLIIEGEVEGTIEMVEHRLTIAANQPCIDRVVTTFERQHLGSQSVQQLEGAIGGLGDAVDVLQAKSAMEWH